MGPHSMAVSLLQLHWSDALDVSMAALSRCLLPDAPFIGVLWGQGSVPELSSVLSLAQMERRAGVSPRCSPLAGGRDVAEALTAAGFVAISVDTEPLEARYTSASELLWELGLQAERGSPANPSPPDRQVMTAALALLENMYREPHDGRIPLSWNAIWFIGWTPGPNAPLPKKRGSATRSFKELDTSRAKKQH